MITREERDSAIDTVHYEFIDILYGWMIREKANLDAFIANPEGHINWNPYMVPDFNALNKRSIQLAGASQALYIINAYKQGSPNFTRAQHDLALDNMPSILIYRLLEWMKIKYNEMVSNTTKLAPIDEYIGLFTVDTQKYQENMTKYSNSINGLKIVHGFAVEQEKLRADALAESQSTITTDGTSTVNATITDIPPLP